LGWVGLGWVGLGWVGLGWVGLGAGRYVGGRGNEGERLEESEGRFDGSGARVGAQDVGDSEGYALVQAAREGPGLLGGGGGGGLQSRQLGQQEPHGPEHRRFTLPRPFVLKRPASHVRQRKRGVRVCGGACVRWCVRVRVRVCVCKGRVQGACARGVYGGEEGQGLLKRGLGKGPPLFNRDSLEHALHGLEGRRPECVAAWGCCCCCCWRR
jgi:hypothetical protein